MAAIRESLQVLTQRRLPIVNKRFCILLQPLLLRSVSCCGQWALRQFMEVADEGHSDVMKWPTLVHLAKFMKIVDS